MCFGAAAGLGAWPQSTSTTTPFLSTLAKPWVYRTAGRSGCPSRTPGAHTTSTPPQVRAAATCCSQPVCTSHLLPAHPLARPARKEPVGEADSWRKGLPGARFLCASPLEGAECTSTLEVHTQHCNGHSCWTSPPPTSSDCRCGRRTSWPSTWNRAARRRGDRIRSRAPRPRRLRSSRVGGDRTSLRLRLQQTC